MEKNNNLEKKKEMNDNKQISTKEVINFLKLFKSMGNIIRNRLDIKKDDKHNAM